MSNFDYRPRSNITGSYSIKREYEQDYIELRNLLKRERISLGDYLVSSYRVLDKNNPNDRRFNEIRINN